MESLTPRPELENSQGQSRSGATSNSNFLAALHSGLEQAHEARGGP